MRKYFIYEHVFPNGKKYIGITCKKRVKDRWSSGYRHNQLMLNAIKKYGWENIDHNVLFQGLNEEDAIKKEVELISFNQSNNVKYGYNLSSGGEFGRKGVKLNENQMRLLMARLKGNSYHLGKPHSEETKKKIRDFHKGKHYSPKTEFPSKKVLCVETGIIYKSMGEAERVTKINHSHISQVCNGIRKMAGGFSWRKIETGG